MHASARSNPRWLPTFALLVTAGASGLWVLARRSPGELQIMLLFAGIAVLAVLGRNQRAEPAASKKLTATLCLGIASGLAVGANLWPEGSFRVEPVIWIFASASLFAIGFENGGAALVPASAASIAMVLAFGVVSAAPAPDTLIQVLAAGFSVLALAIGFAAATPSPAISAAALAFISAGVTASVATAQQDRLWTTATLLLICAGMTLAEIQKVPKVSNPLVASDGARISWPLGVAAALTGAGAITAAGSAKGSLAWPMIGAITVGMAGLGWWARVALQRNDVRVAALERAAAESRSDQLTGLANRRGMMERMSIETARAERFQHPLSALVLDIDDFKLVNDRFGHTQGDLVLRQVADSIGHSIRSIDVAGRIGGEEFLVLLPETGLAGASVVAERIRAATERSGRVTVSIGISQLDRLAPRASSLLETADHALYRAKRSGKNRVESAS